MAESKTPKGRRDAQNSIGSTDQPTGNRGGKGSQATGGHSKNPATKSILVIGRRGSGKTSFINTVGCVPVLETSKGVEPTTLKFYDTRAVSLGSHQFKLIDSPGFDNVRLSDHEIFVRLIRHLAPRPGRHQELTGIIYIHSQGDNLGSAALLKNIKALKSLLGDDYLKRVTIVTLLTPSDSSRSFDIADCPGSPFHELGGAIFRAFKLNRKEVADALLAYAPYQAEHFGAQKTIIRRQINTNDFGKFLEEILSPTKSLPPKLAQNDRSLEQESLKKALDERTIEVDALRNQLQKTQSDWNPEREKLKKALDERTAEADALRNELHKIQNEYVSLRSHFQIHENVERSQVAQSLVDLNRKIDDLGHAISNYLSDAYSKPEATSLDAHQSSELKAMFRHTKGQASLVESSKGNGMFAPDFFDYAIRSILCHQLCQSIFKPFHPGVADPNALSMAYKEVQRQESQPLVGMWRKQSFDSVSSWIGTSGITKATSQITKKILSSGIDPLLGHFFEPSLGISLEQRHIKHLGELVSSAWDLNEFLKKSVVVLGDFQPIAYQYGESFDSVLMSEFEGKKGGDTPSHILSTIGLGMQHVYAVGGGKDPEVSVLSRALVITESVFD